MPYYLYSHKIGIFEMKRLGGYTCDFCSTFVEYYNKRYETWYNKRGKKRKLDICLKCYEGKRYVVSTKNKKLNEVVRNTEGSSVPRRRTDKCGSDIWYA